MVSVSPDISAASAGTVTPPMLARTSVHTPLRSSIVALSSMTGTGAACSGFSRLSLMEESPSPSSSWPSCSVPVMLSTTSAPSYIAHWDVSTSPLMFISAVPSAPMVTVISMPMSASG